MRLSFTKMHGAGNDFVVLDNRDGAIHLTEAQVATLCHRRFGIGADGVLLLERPEDPNAFDARMIYYNADGSRAEMCGNGARCFAAFARTHGVGTKEQLRFLTDAGPVTATTRDGQITIEMTEPKDLRLHQAVALQAGEAIVHHVDTGVPHVVEFVEDAAAVDIRARGAELRFHPAFAPRGANANFAQVRPDGSVLVRTYERGVEDETLACGTGVTAVGLLAHLVRKVARPVRLQVASGEWISVDFERNGDRLDHVTMTGRAVTVFTGEIEIAD